MFRLDTEWCRLFILGAKTEQKEMGQHYTKFTGLEFAKKAAIREKGSEQVPEN